MKMTRQFKQRMLTGSLSLLGLVMCIYYSFTPFFKPIFILLNAGIISFALLEYYRLAQHKGFQPLKALGIGCSVAYVLAVGFFTSMTMLPPLILLASLLLCFLLFFNRKSSALGNLAITIFGIVYLTIPLSCILRINYFFPTTALEDGRFWLAYVLIVSKMTDIGAYFCGKIFGKTPLAPAISPKKTREGALGGMGASLITSILIALIFPMTAESFQMTFWQSVWMGLLMSILAQLGDLAESLLKRDAGVKDSSQLPGLGGVLDIVDSLVFTLPLMYLFLKMQLVG